MNLSEAHPENIDRRVMRSRAAVLKETYVLLTEGGIGGVSVDAVSRRSGVSKTTIYRHWPSRSALLLDACANLGGRAEPPDTGSFAGDLFELTEALSEQLRSAPWATVLPSIIDAAERDPEVASIHALLQAQFTAPFLVVTQRAIQRGDLRHDADPAVVVAGVLGPLYYRRWFSKEPIDARFVSAIIRSVGGGA